MTARRPLIIVTVPARTAEEARRQILEAQRSGADWAEVRLDRWREPERDRLGALFPSSLPLLVTLRSGSEGGEGPSEAEERDAVLRRALRFPLAGVDLEREHDARLLAELRSNPSPSGPLVVESTHILDHTWTRRLPADVAEPDPSQGFRKLVFPATLAEFFDSVLPVLRSLASRPWAIMTTGPSGPLSRAWSGRFGLRAVYATLPAGGDRFEERVEPSQLPVDRLEPYLRGASRAPLFGVMGSPIVHSASPALHHFWMDRLGDVGLYLPLEVRTPSELARLLGPLGGGASFRGLNVTRPWKAEALTLAARASDEATQSGCANTLTFEPDGIAAHNTDVPAMERRLNELRESGRWNGTEILVVGAGGAARAALAAVRRIDAPSRVLARNPEAAKRLAEAFATNWGEPQRAPSLLIHATSAGRADSPTLGVPLDRWMSESTHVVDYVDRPLLPIVAEAAQRAGATYEDGRRLLAYQGAASYAVWWGHAPAPADVESAITTLP